jgi:hypothetical protein
MRCSRRLDLTHLQMQAASSDKRRSATSTILIRPLTEGLIPALRDFNSRLDAAGAPGEFRFPESHISNWLPKSEHRRLYEEHFALLDNRIVRGGYILKHQDFSFHGVIRSIGFWHWPISEGMVNNNYSCVAPRMLGTGLKAKPLIYGLNMTDQLTRLLATLGWSLYRVPFYFKGHSSAKRGISAGPFKFLCRGVTRTSQVA